MPHSMCGARARADAMFDVPGMHVLDVQLDDQTRLVLTAETDLVEHGCPSCGVIAVGHGRRIRSAGLRTRSATNSPMRCRPRSLSRGTDRHTRSSTKSIAASSKPRSATEGTRTARSTRSVDCCVAASNTSLIANSPGSTRLGTPVTPTSKSPSPGGTTSACGRPTRPGLPTGDPSPSGSSSRSTRSRLLSSLGHGLLSSESTAGLWHSHPFASSGPSNVGLELGDHRQHGE